MQLRHATFHPWTEWPGDGVLGPVYDSFSGADLSPDFRAGQSSDGHFALLIRHDAPGGAFLLFAPEVDADASGLAPDLTLAATAPLFVTLGSEPWGGPEQPDYDLVGTGQAGTISAYFELVASPAAGQPLPLGCASSPILADASGYSQGWLVALSNAGNAPDLGCGGVDPSPPTRIDFVYLALIGPPSYLGSFDAGAPIESLAVAPHPRGVYVVFRVASAGAVAPLQWLRFDAPTQKILGPADLTGPTDAPMPAFAASSLGSDLAVAWGNDPAGDPPDLVVSVLDQAGSPKASATLADRFHSSVSILGRGDGQSLLVAWDETDPATQNSAITLARFAPAP